MACEATKMFEAKSASQVQSQVLYEPYVAPERSAAARCDLKGSYLGVISETEGESVFNNQEQLIAESNGSVADMPFINDTNNLMNEVLFTYEKRFD